MKKLLLLTLLLITNHTFSQKLETQTFCSGSGSANSGTYTYEANLNASSYLPGMKDVRYKLALSNYKITSFTYKGIDASTVDGVSFPININNIQAKVKFTLQYYNSTLSKGFNNLEMRAVEQSFGDYADLSSSQIESLKNKLNIKSSEDFYNLNLKIYNCNISKIYFEELSRIRTLIDSKIQNEKRIREEESKGKTDDSKNANKNSSNTSSNTNNNSSSSNSSSSNTNNSSNSNNTSNRETQRQRLERERKEHSQKLAREQIEWAERQEAKRIADNKAAEEIAGGIIAIGKMFERSPEQIERSKKRRERRRERRQENFQEYKKTYKSSIRVFGGVTMSELEINEDDFSRYTEYDSKIGFHLGAIAELFPISESISFETGLTLTSKGNKTKITTDRVIESTNNSYFLDVPFQLKISSSFKNNKRFNATFGPYIGVFFFGEGSGKTTDNHGVVSEYSNSVNLTEVPFKLDYGLNLGVSLDINKLFIGASYSRGLANIAENDYNNENSNNITYNVSIGYRIK